MAEQNAVKCKGCGCEVWAGSKIIDGYCHDCYARGRHLPPIVEDPPYTPQKKKPQAVPDSKPSSCEQNTKEAELRKGLLGRLNLGHRHWPRWKLALILLLVAGIVFGFVYGVRTLTGSESVPESGSESGSGSVAESEPEDIRALRAMRYADFINGGERIPGETLSANAEAIEAFIHSGTSYRMSGAFEYAYYDHADMGQLKKNRTEVEMSYNSDTDVYQFALAGSGDISETLEDLGTYYIVKENGMTHILHSGDGNRTVIGIDEGVVFYEFLSQYFMENLVRTDFFTDANTTALQYGDGGFYSIPCDDTGNSTVIYDSLHRIELRTYQNKPISWYDCDRDSETAIEWQTNVEFYYDNIPTDAPGVADWR